MELNKWLKSLKVDVYLMNFVNNGYHSLDLLLMQMERLQRPHLFNQKQIKELSIADLNIISGKIIL